MTAAIKRAREEAIANAKAKAKADAEKERLANIATKSVAPSTRPVTRTVKKVAAPENVLLPTAADVTLNASFISNRGSLPWPVDKGYVIMRYGMSELPNGVKVDNPGITIGGDIGASVKAVFDGEVSAVNNIEDMQMVVLKHGGYFSAYSNLSGVSLTRGQVIHTGQVIGKIAVNDEGVGSIDLIISNDKNNLNPETWLKHR